ncbi:unnamed protein product [Ectocarpus sp. 12 AP-2014]
MEMKQQVNSREIITESNLDEFAEMFGNIGGFWASHLREVSHQGGRTHGGCYQSDRVCGAEQTPQLKEACGRGRWLRRVRRSASVGATTGTTTNSRPSQPPTGRTRPLTSSQ